MMNKNKTKLTELMKNDKSNPEFSALAQIETFFQIDGISKRLELQRCARDRWIGNIL